MFVAFLTGSLLPVLGVPLLEALHDSPALQKHSLELQQSVAGALQEARRRAPPPSHFQEEKRVPLGSLTLLEFTSDGLLKRTPASPAFIVPSRLILPFLDFQNGLVVG